MNKTKPSGPEIPMSLIVASKDASERLTSIAVSIASLAIKDDASLQSAATLLGDIKAMYNDAEEHRKAEKAPFLEGGRQVDEKFKPVTTWLSDQEVVVKRAIRDYTDEMERRRRAEQARLEAEAAAERQKLMSMAEEEPDEELKEALVTEALVTHAPIVAATPMASGIGKRGAWKAEVVDPAAFIQWLAEHPDSLYIEAVKFDSAILNRFAATLQERLTIPGLKVWKDTVITSRASKKAPAPTPAQEEEEW